MTDRPRSASRPRRALRLGPAEHSLLGLLAGAGEEGIHGYDLARQFSHGALGEIIRLEPGMLYHHLKKLDRYRLITTEIERQVDRPDRRIHTLTLDGREALDQWLQEPVHATREIRLDFLLKLFFTRRLAPARLAHLIGQQRAVLTDLLRSLTAQMEVGTAAPDAERRMVLRLRLAQTEAALEWLDSLDTTENNA
ncbi:MAG TPA: helix-turn-helix transcriptional regulator [Thermomicrobiales bacterium]|nr:helix-turn-helix transcriptional regulator [Thermomicrobiales bacterium]